MSKAEATVPETRVGGDVAAELRALVQLGRDAFQRLTRLLDELDPHARVRAVRTLGRAEQRTLWAAAEGCAPLSLTDLVPAGTPLGREVRHFGKNTLPVYSRFEKRFCRVMRSDSPNEAELCGYNFQESALSTALCGPGYFMATEDIRRGEVVVDYRRVPAQRPTAWPSVRSNEGGTAALVYGGMVDTLRRVSKHVTIGRANKGGKDMSAWFVLCREV